MAATLEDVLMVLAIMFIGAILESRAIILGGIGVIGYWKYRGDFNE